MGIARKKFTGAGTYMFVVPGGVKHIDAIGCGGGGSGAGGQNGTTTLSSRENGGGGGGGAPKKTARMAVVPGETLTIVIGAAGALVAAHTNGNDGVASTITGSTSGLLATFKAGSRGYARSGANVAIAGGRWGTDLTSNPPTPAKTPFAGGRSYSGDATATRAYGSLSDAVQPGATGAASGGTKFGGMGGGAGGSGPFGSHAGTGGNGGAGAVGAGNPGSDGTPGTEGGGGGGGGAGGTGTTSGGAGGQGAAGGDGVITLEWSE